MEEKMHEHTQENGGLAIPLLEMYPLRNMVHPQVFMLINGVSFGCTIHLASQARNGSSTPDFSFPHPLDLINQQPILVLLPK